MTTVPPSSPEIPVSSEATPVSASDTERDISKTVGHRVDDLIGDPNALVESLKPGTRVIITSEFFPDSEEGVVKTFGPVSYVVIEGDRHIFSRNVTSCELV